MHISNQNKILVATGFVLMASLFASQANAQQYPSGGMPAMPATTQVSGKYTNSDYGVDITLPDGWSGMEMKMSGGLTGVSAMPGGLQSAKAGAPSTMMEFSMVNKNTTKTPPTSQPQNMPQGETCSNTSSTTKTVNGVNLLETIVECTGTVSMKMKSDMAQTDKYYIGVTYIAMPATNYDSNVAAFDTAVNSLHVANAIAAPAAPQSTTAAQTPAVPEFPTAIVGMISAIMMGFAIMVTRRAQLKI